jgi:hypothetical protein
MSSTKTSQQVNSYCVAEKRQGHNNRDDNRRNKPRIHVHSFKLMAGSFFMFLVSYFAMQRAIHVQGPRLRQVQDPRVDLIGTDAAMSAGCGSAGIRERLSFHVHERQPRTIVPVDFQVLKIKMWRRLVNPKKMPICHFRTGQPCQGFIRCLFQVLQAVSYNGQGLKPRIIVMITISLAEARGSLLPIPSPATRIL